MFDDLQITLIVAKIDIMDWFCWNWVDVIVEDDESSVDYWEKSLLANGLGAALIEYEQELVAREKSRWYSEEEMEEELWRPEEEFVHECWTMP